MKIYILIVTALLCSNLSYSQKVEKGIPLFHFLQNHADSTIVIEYVSNWIQKPILQILSKKDDTISTYSYADNRAFRKIGVMPKNIRDSLYKKNRLDIFSTPIDVNVYFNSIYLTKDSSTIFWKNTIKIKPWLLKDDAEDGEGCKANIKNEQDLNIYDGGGINLYLITKKY